MALRYSFERGDLADMVEAAVKDVLDSGKRTGDIMSKSCTEVSCSEMGKAVCEALESVKAKIAA